MPYALINTLSQITVPSQITAEGHVTAGIVVDVVIKVVCILLAVGLYYVAARQKV